jgi:hypothetical protein
MVEFKSWRSYWAFECAVKTRTRYVYDPDVKSFLDTVLATAGRRVEAIPAAAYFWRAQQGNDLRPIYEGNEFLADEPAPHLPERMKPPRDRSREGRANPKGITYLYLANDRETASAEVRPWIGSLMSVGQFKTLRALRLVNCTTDGQGHRMYIGREPSPSEREESVWADIDRAFAKPVDPSDDLADYAPYAGSRGTLQDKRLRWNCLPKLIGTRAQYCPFRRQCGGTRQLLSLQGREPEV